MRLILAQTRNMASLGMFCIAWFWLASSLLGSPFAIVDDQALLPTMSEVVAGFETWRNSIQSVWLTCETQGKSVINADAEAQSTRREMAFENHQRMHQVVHLLSDSDWDADPTANRIYLRPGVVKIFWLVDHVTMVSKNDARPMSNEKLQPIYAEFFLLASGWWPPGGDTTAPIPEWSPPSTATHLVLTRPECRLDPEWQRVGDLNCVLVHCQLRERTDRFWLDPSRGYVLVKRVSILPAAKTSVVYENEDFRESKGGLWVPWQLKRKIYTTLDENQFTDEHLMSWTDRRLTDLRINDLPEQVFEKQYMPGEIVQDQDGDTQEFIPGGLDVLERFAMRAIKRLQGTTRSSATFGPSSLVWLVGINIGLVALAGTLRVLRRSPS